MPVKTEYSLCIFSREIPRIVVMQTISDLNSILFSIAFGTYGIFVKCLFVYVRSLKQNGCSLDKINKQIRTFLTNIRVRNNIVRVSFSIIYPIRKNAMKIYSSKLFALNVFSIPKRLNFVSSFLDLISFAFLICQKPNAFLSSLSGSIGRCLTVVKSSVNSCFYYD